jgi:peptidoglycan hydrolase-like protein with peptidoglycan-binding domain
MARIVTNTLLFLFLVSGCASWNKEETGALKATEPAPAPISSTPVETTSDQARPVAPTGLSLTKEDIRMLQARLKAAGFYMGPIDGIPGPKTRSGILRLQAACGSLKDLLENSAPGNQTGKLDGTANSSPESEEIRLIQVRLKDAGFDPGPIDGVSGAKTRAALLRFEAGCTMLKNLPPTLDKESQTADKPTFLTGREKNHPTVATSVGLGSDTMSADGNQTPSGEKIRQEQLRLRDAGFDPGPIDGILGPKTKAAMQRYQKLLAMKNSR